MNPSIIKSFALAIFIGLITGCGSSSDPAPTPACKLLTSIYNSPSVTTTATYVYEGELLKTKVDSYIIIGAGASTITNT